MKYLILVSMLSVVVSHGAEEDKDKARLKEVAKAVAKGEQEALAALADLHSEEAAQFVLGLVGNNRIGGGIKARTAEIVAAWPTTAPGRKTLHDWLARHPNCDDDTLLFFADTHLPETRGYFWNLIEQAKGEPAQWRQPQRIAMAVKGLGYFEDNPEIVVTRVGSLLAAAAPHVIRACAADALGGMKHARAVEALIPLVEDDAIGPRVQRSLYRLTGQHFDQQPESQWQAWLKESGGKIDFKMHTAVDFENFLKMQALVKPVPDDGQMNMSTFYGIDVRGKGLLFILDVSGSMSFEDRISKLRGQMQNILTIFASRPASTRYGIITFGDNIESCFPRGVMDNSDENRRRATRFVEKLQADGGTPMVEALTYAYNKVLPDADIDTIFFLSDGQPSDGTPQMVLDLTRKIFQRHQTRFNTISIGENMPAEFGKPSLLGEMSMITQGSFTQPK
ncbi:MAG: VWA domain-containing protein [Prosthecobacter sp.]